jgi:hypothetical protein
VKHIDFFSLVFSSECLVCNQKGVIVMKLLQCGALLFVVIVLGGLSVLFYESAREVEVIVNNTNGFQPVSAPMQQDSPLPTPEPIPTSEPISPEAQAALNFIAEQEAIPIEQLVVAGEEAKTFPLLGQDYVLVNVLRNQADALRTFQVLVDPDTLAVEPDASGIIAAEQIAFQERYGKFEPQLYDQLQGSSDDAQIPVIIWAAEIDNEDSVKAAEAEVASLYSEAAEALAQTGIAWAVEDEKLRLEIKQKFAELLAARSAERVQPLVDWLQAKGYTMELVDGSPIVAATLSKQDILELAELDAAGSIQLGGGQAAPSSNIAVPTGRVPMVWSRAISGSGVRLAIVEQGKINATARGCLNVIETRDNSLGDLPHKSRVAAITACNNGSLPGVAQGAQLMDAGYPIAGTEVDAANALTWAVDVKLADVTNQSERILAQQTDTNLYYLDKFYDYKVRVFKFTAVVAAGNRDVNSNVGTPAKGWNVIAVGNAEDQNTAAWSDDKINETASGSSYINPNTGVEKPEVAAPGTNINTVAGQDSGTSLAAPHVAGLAALLMQRNSLLKDMPMAVKAIIMATAVHNVEGTNRLSDKDGAGGVDAALADWVAQTEGVANTCGVPCWWHVPLDDNILPEPDPGTPTTSLSRYFPANRGERIRVVISWLSAASADGVQDNLRTELNLHVKRPNGTVIQSSTSSSNGFEIADFTADATGTYEIRVERLYLGAFNESENKLGIAWVRLGSYLPEVRRNSEGWSSTVYVRNDDSQPWSGRISFFDQTGDYEGDISTTVQPGAVWSGPSLPNNWQGTAIINGSDDISVVVRQDKNGLATLDNTYTPGGATDPAWGQAMANLPNSALYGPVLYNNAFGGFNSTLFVNNLGGTTANVGAALYGRSGYGDYFTGFTMGPHNQQVLTMGQVLNHNNQWVGSLSLYGDRLIAVRIFESKGTGESRSYNAAAAGRKLVYVPAAYKNAFNLLTGLVVQQVGGFDNTNVTLTYCERFVTNPASCPTQVITLTPQRAEGVNLNNAPVPNGWSGSVKIESTLNMPLAVAVTNSRTDFAGGYSFNGTGYGSKLVILPRAARDAAGRTTGYTVRNVSGQNNVTVTARYYTGSTGVFVASRTFTLQNAQSDGYHQSNDTFLSAGWEGSIVLEATADIIAIMREDTTSTVSGYNGVSR